MIRHCLRIPFVIGQHDSTIIGSACADNPVWTVPCDPVNIPEDLAGAANFPTVDCTTGTSLDDSDGAATLPEPPLVTVSL